MSKTALEDTHYELIKSHVINPDNSPLNHEQQEMLERITSVAKVLDKNPIQKNAIALHMAKFTHIGRTQAYKDVRMAVRLFNTLHNFDFDFWQAWIVNDIVKNIERARNDGKAASLRVIAMEHANLIKAIGEKPAMPPDPELTEKHDFYIIVNVQNQQFKLDYSKVRDLPEATRQELTKALFAGAEIVPEEAIEIMKS